MREPPEHMIPWTWPAAGSEDGNGPAEPGGPGRRGGSRPSDLGVIALASLDESCGKTMLAAHFAVSAELWGAGPVAALHTGLSGALEPWRAARDADRPTVVLSFVPRFGDDLRRLRGLGHRLCVVDVARPDSEGIDRIFRSADVIVVPTRPDRHSIGMARRTLRRIESARTKAVLVVNGAEAGAPDMPRAARYALSIVRDGALAPVVIHRSDAIADAMKRGRTVIETDPDCGAAAEITRLWAYLAGRLQPESR